MNNEVTQNQPFSGATSEASARTLQLFRAGSFQFGIFTNEIATIAEWREPTPLPHAPKSVMGVVSLQGRMLTVLDLATLAGEGNAADDGPLKQIRRQSPGHIIALRGDEQLGLSVDVLAETIEGADIDLPGKRGSVERFVLGVINHGGAEISILNVKELFSTAIQGRERRRRRF